MFQHLARPLATTLLSCAWALAIAPFNTLGGLSPQADQSNPVKIEIFENVKTGSEFELTHATPAEEFYEPAMALAQLPTKYSSNALALDRSVPFVIRATFESTVGTGTFQFRLRSKGMARFMIGDESVLSTKPQKANSTGDDPVPLPPRIEMPSLRPAPYSHQEVVATVQLDGRPRRFTLLAVIGGKGLVPTPGELSVSFGPPEGLPRLLGSDAAPRLTDNEWERYVFERKAKHRQADITRRLAASAGVRAQWEAYHVKVRDWLNSKPAPTIPPRPDHYPESNLIDRFVSVKLANAQVATTDSLNDLEFLRRLALDAIGQIPSRDELRQYLNNPPATRRQQAIDYYLAHSGWADHWVSYWQDVLAENPGILKPDLNNSGPFRWWLHQSFSDNIPFDRMAVELVEMEGSVYQGAPAAFKLATLNDSPLAAKADILAQAFLGERLSCARCHDAPNHPHKQKDTFALAAMLEGKPLAVPVSSTVPFVEGFRKPRVDVTLAPGQKIEPHWPFHGSAQPSEITRAVPVSETVPASRRDVAALIVSPDNDRFAQVIVNRVWKRYIGFGFVESAEDWQGVQPSHPDLLKWLAREFVLSGYDLKALARLIFSSHLYQRRPDPAVAPGSIASDRLFAGPMRRRLTAEQLIDSLYQCAGKQFDCEELNLNPAGNRPLNQFLNLGVPRRAWEFTALMNERDRPALALPVAQSIVDVLTTFGWRQSRQNPVTVREDAASPMQTLLLANGIVGTRIMRLSDDSEFTDLAVQCTDLKSLVTETFLRILSREPSTSESAIAESFLGAEFPKRIGKGATKQKSNLAGDTRVTWGNHLSAEATVIRMEEERRLRMGDQPTGRLSQTFRERYEDLIWSLVNAPEFCLIP